MKKIWISILLCIFFTFSSMTLTRSIEPENKPWLGNWDILWDLTQMSMMDKVLFEEDEGILSGKTQWGSGFMIGYVTGQFFKGTWAREPSFDFPDHGDLELTISGNGNQFAGRWRIGTEEDELIGKPVGEWAQISGTKSGKNLMDPPPAKPKKGFIVIVLQINNSLMRVDERVVEIDPGRKTTPLILNGSTLCPIRAIVEALGGSIAWNGTEQKITITLKNLKLELWINKKTAKANGKSKTLNVPPQIINGRTMVPVRFVSEELGGNVLWDPSSRIITIEYPLTGKKPGDDPKPPDDQPKCSIRFSIVESVHLSNRDEEERTKKERWRFILEAVVQNAPDNVVLAYEWKYGDNGSWGDRSKDTKVTALLSFTFTTSPFEQPEQPVAVRIWDWTNGKVLATYESTVARPIKIK